MNIAERRPAPQPPAPVSYDVFFFGTRLPSLRASESAMAIACLRLLTLAPPRPLFAVPRQQVERGPGLVVDLHPLARHFRSRSHLVMAGPVPTVYVFI